MLTKFIYILFGLFLIGVFQIIYSVPIMFVSGLLLGIENELVLQVQWYFVFALAAGTSFWLIFKIWPREKVTAPSNDVNTTKET